MNSILYILQRVFKIYTITCRYSKLPSSYYLAVNEKAITDLVLYFKFKMIGGYHEKKPVFEKYSSINLQKLYNTNQILSLSFY